MKRLLALLLSAVMLTGMPLPALAEGEAADAQLTQVTQMVKETLDLDTSGYDNFQGERWQQELATVCSSIGPVRRHPYRWRPWRMVPSCPIP